MGEFSMLHRHHLGRLTVLLVVAALFMTLVAPAAAQGNATIVNASRVNLRSGPGAGFSVVTVLTVGQQIYLLGANADASWYQVQTTYGQSGWVAARFVSANYGGITVPQTAPTGSQAASVNTPFLTSRSGPGANFPDIGTVAQGQTFNLVGRNADNSWVQINIPGGIQGGWVSARYIASGTPIGYLPLVSNTGVSPAYPQAVPVWGQTGIVTAPRLNVRYGPGSWYGAFTRLSQGEGVSLIGRDAGGAWLLVQMANGTTGWVSSGFITSTYPFHQLPVRV
jgi:uncharacterized protein YraI